MVMLALINNLDLTNLDTKPFLEAIDFIKTTVPEQLTLNEHLANTIADNRHVISKQSLTNTIINIALVLTTRWDDLGSFTHLHIGSDNMGKLISKDTSEVLIEFLPVTKGSELLMQCNLTDADGVLIVDYESSNYVICDNFNILQITANQYADRVMALYRKQLLLIIYQPNRPKFNSKHFSYLGGTKNLAVMSYTQ